MTRVSLALVAAYALVLTVPGAVAQIDNCTRAAGTPNPVSPFPFGPTVVGSQAHRDFIYAAPCWSVVGNNGSGPIPPCTTGNSGVVQWCDPSTPIAFGQLVQCGWMSLTAVTTIFDYVVGIDVNGDGNIFPGEPAMRSDLPQLPATPAVTYPITFNAPAAGTLIAYPVSLLSTGSPLDVSRILCI